MDKSEPELTLDLSNMHLLTRSGSPSLVVPPPPKFWSRTEALEHSAPIPISVRKVCNGPLEMKTASVFETKTLSMWGTVKYSEPRENEEGPGSKPTCGFEISDPQNNGALGTVPEKSRNGPPVALALIERDSTPSVLCGRPGPSLGGVPGLEPHQGLGIISAKSGEVPTTKFGNPEPSVNDFIVYSRNDWLPAAGNARSNKAARGDLANEISVSSRPAQISIPRSTCKVHSSYSELSNAFSKVNTYSIRMEESTDSPSSPLPL
jgi:hypothetical protein